MHRNRIAQKNAVLQIRKILLETPSFIPFMAPPLLQMMDSPRTLFASAFVANRSVMQMTDLKMPIAVA